MQKSSRAIALVCAAIVAPGLSGCSRSSGLQGSAASIVGAWLVKDSGAPFPYHMYVFNADGTMQQANPDAGDPHSSDSDGKGAWTTDGKRVKGRWVEVIADRSTHGYTGRMEIAFDLEVNGDTFSGTESARGYGANEALTQGPTPPELLEGKRVTPH